MLIRLGHLSTVFSYKTKYPFVKSLKFNTSSSTFLVLISDSIAWIFFRWIVLGSLNLSFKFSLNIFSWLNYCKFLKYHLKNSLITNTYDCLLLTRLTIKFSKIIPTSIFWCTSSNTFTILLKLCNQINFQIIDQG